MKALSLLLISLISLPVFASYQRGTTRIQENSNGQTFYSCEVMNNDRTKYVVESIIYNYTCNDAIENMNILEKSCSDDCELSAYSIKIFEGPEACKDGSISTPTCGIEFSVNE